MRARVHAAQQLTVQHTTHHARGGVRTRTHCGSAATAAFGLPGVLQLFFDLFASFRFNKCAMKSNQLVTVTKPKAAKAKVWDRYSGVLPSLPSALPIRVRVRAVPLRSLSDDDMSL